jgi:hypothetical protein
MSTTKSFTFEIAHANRNQESLTCFAIFRDKKELNAQDFPAEEVIIYDQVGGVFED